MEPEMSDTVMETKDLPVFIEQKFGTKSIRILECANSLTLQPMQPPTNKYNCPFLGLLKHQKGMSEEQIIERRASERG
jgi:hypothetical protein